ncbi:unnamed protein product [marine sediment metagenome]|uniref:Cthe-2314-like HEPN domain-containing protein n=1 Tax=marine sediment metagenome TaxID=412755 RepID=X0UVG2_9ZZZZ
MTEKLQTEYREAVYRALERFQFIEETLRMYLDLVIQIAKIELTQYFPVNLTKKDLSKLSLGKLKDMFSRFNGNASLKSSLKKVTPDRNRVAHQSLLFTLGELKDNAHLTKLIHEMNEIESRAKEVHETLLDERWKLHKLLNILRHSKKHKGK